MAESSPCPPRPAVNHNIAIVNITRIFGNYLDGKSCTVFSDGADVYLTKKDRVAPDVMIVCNKDIIKKNGIHESTTSLYPDMTIVPEKVFAGTL